MDGKTNPIEAAPSLPEEIIEEIIQDYIDMEVLRDKWYRFEDGVVTVPCLNLSKLKISTGMRRACLIVSLLMALLCLPVLIFGLVHLKNVLPEVDWANVYIGIYGAIIPSVILHEFSHAVSEWSRPGGKVYEMGFLLAPLVGAYVVPDDESGKHSLYFECQMNAAGIEMHFLLAGVSFLFQPLGGGVLLGFGVMNLIFGLFNLAAFPMLDGGHLFRALMSGTYSKNDGFISALDTVSHYIVVGEGICTIVAFIFMLIGVWFI